MARIGTVVQGSTSGSSGTVTSVTYTGDNVLQSPTPSAAVTTSGTLAATLKAFSANTFIAGPTSGAAANPTARLLSSLDIPVGFGALYSNTGTFNVKDNAYGALGNGKVLSDITTNSTTTISSASYTFTAADVGKLITINAGATISSSYTGTTAKNDIITGMSSVTGLKIGQSVFGTGIPAGAYIKEIISTTSIRMNMAAAFSSTYTFTFIGVLNTSIASVSGGNAVLTTACSSSISGTALATFGTDDTSTIQSAINAANTAGGGTVILPVGMYIVSSLVWYSNISLIGFGWGKSILKHIKTTDMTAGVIIANDTTGATYYYNCQFRNFEIDCLAATMATPGVPGKGISMPYLIRGHFSGLYIHNSPATALAYDAAVSVICIGNIIENGGRLKPSAGGAGIGNGVGEGVTSGGSIIAPFAEQRFSQCNNNVVINAYSNGIFYETQIVTPATAPSVQDTVQINSNMVYMGGASVKGITDSGCTGIEITGNTVYCNGVGSNLYGISSSGGTFANSAGVQGLIANNLVYNANIGVDYSVTTADPQQFSGYQVLNNKIMGNGTCECTIVINTGLTALNTLTIKGNQVSGSNTSGIIIANSGGGGINDLDIDGNTCCNNAVTTSTATRKCGISLGSPVTRLRMTNNKCFDNTAGQKQLYGLIINNVAITGAYIANNDFQHNATGAINLISGTTIAGQVINNNGYNPLGTSSVTPGASPWTYTAGVTPEVLYLYGGTVSGITKNSITLATATSATVAIPIALDPNDSVIVTYTLAPTAVSDKL